MAKKRKTGVIEGNEEPATRIRRSLVMAFDFKKQGLFCGTACKRDRDPKHPDRLDRVIQCERTGLKESTPFKTVVLQYCTDRNDVWSREVNLRCSGVHDLAAAEAQYHVRCYDEFRKVPAIPDQSRPLIDEAMQLVVDEMYANRQVRTWTFIELHEKYVNFGGQLTRKQMFTKVVTHLGSG